MKIKHLKHPSEILAKTPENHVKLTQHPDKTLATYM
jgi:hypothetical protein